MYSTWTVSGAVIGLAVQDVIFTDESSIELSWHKRTCRTKKGQHSKLKPKPKHPLKVHVWAGISCQGGTKICIFTDIMVSEIYSAIEKVLNELKRYIEGVVKPFKKEELVEGILEFWKTRMSPDKCRRYISHLSKVLPKVVEKHGGPTGE